MTSSDVFTSDVASVGESSNLSIYESKLAKLEGKSPKKGAADQVNSCLVKTKGGGLSARIIKIADAKLSLWQHAKGKLVDKLSIDLFTANACYDPQILVESTNDGSNKGKACDEFQVFPIRIKLPGNTKQIMHFTNEADRKSIMMRIMQAQGYAGQIDQYQVIKQMSSTTVKAQHKASGKVYAIKVISEAQQYACDE